jgi:hypothetical protein
MSKTDKNTKFATTLTELEKALQAWDAAVTQQPAAAIQAQAPLYETKLIKELCKQLRDLSKD